MNTYIIKVFKNMPIEAEDRHEALDKVDKLIEKNLLDIQEFDSEVVLEL